MRSAVADHHPAKNLIVFLDGERQSGVIRFDEHHGCVERLAMVNGKHVHCPSGTGLLSEYVYGEVRVEVKK